jgi:hypothetical protein
MRYVYDGSRPMRIRAKSIFPPISYVRNDPVNLIDPDGAQFMQVNDDTHEVEDNFGSSPGFIWIVRYGYIEDHIWFRQTGYSIITGPGTMRNTPSRASGSRGASGGGRQTPTFEGTFQNNTKRAVTNAYNQALAILSDPSSQCAKALGVNGANPYSYLQDTVFKADPLYTQYMSITPGVAYTINVNPKAGDYTYDPRQITNPIPSNQTMTFAILHELGHLLDVLPADSTPEQQRANNDYIQANCFPKAGKQ